jgi:hypothetical protein
MGNANKDSEEERNLPKDLSRDRPNPRPIPEFHSIMRGFLREDLLSGWQSWKLTFNSTMFLIIKNKF